MVTANILEKISLKSYLMAKPRKGKRVKDISIRQKVWFWLKQHKLEVRSPCDQADHMWFSMKNFVLYSTI